jgi:hypothetical protein
MKGGQQQQPIISEMTKTAVEKPAKFSRNASNSSRTSQLL